MSYTPIGNYLLLSYQLTLCLPQFRKQVYNIVRCLEKFKYFAIFLCKIVVSRHIILQFDQYAVALLNP